MVYSPISASFHVRPTYVIRYYKISSNLPGYACGDFWDFDASNNGGPGDMVPDTKPLLAVFNRAMQESACYRLPGISFPTLSRP